MLVRPTSTLTYAGARVALDAALAAAAAMDAAFNVAVTDGAGMLLAFARMDGAFAESGLIAQDKARTVARFGGIPSGSLYAALKDEPDVATGILTRPRVAAFGGGVPILLGGELVGAIGASGGSAAQDARVAEAGAAAVVDAAARVDEAAGVDAAAAADPVTAADAR